jgi:hypothetical protein|tara:strand:+ start:386 stop:865 length:480 start_codon:yes stop_codon:yes gene_type:complete
VYELGGRRSLQVAFNVLNEGCGGCQYETYPYKAQLPVRVNGKYPTWEFKSDEDVLKVVDLIIEETIEFNLNNNKDFDISNSVYNQLPFFGCRNILYDRELQKDIQRYIYCEKFNISPYKGDYGKQPCLWVEKSFLIRKYMAKLESKQLDKVKKDGTRKN